MATARHNLITAQLYDWATADSTEVSDDAITALTEIEHRNDDRIQETKLYLVPVCIQQSEPFPEVDELVKAATDAKHILTKSIWCNDLSDSISNISRSYLAEEMIACYESTGDWEKAEQLIAQLIAKDFDITESEVRKLYASSIRLIRRAATDEWAGVDRT